MEYNSSQELEYINTDEGRIRVEGSEFYYDYYHKDHLGNTRVVFTDSLGNAESLQVNNYYPFGMRFDQAPVMQKEANNYLYNGKEIQEDYGLNWVDYGARFYDAALGRWFVIDPMAERRIEWSNYAYVGNNPITRIDLLGLTDYTMNKKTGEINEVTYDNEEEQKANKAAKTDRIVKTYKWGKHKGEIKRNKEGKVKVEMDGIAKRILKDGINFMEDDNIIDVCGENQPTEDDVKSFALKLSENIGKEIKGFAYSYNASKDATDTLLTKYKNNSLTDCYGTPNELLKNMELAILKKICYNNSTLILMVI